MASPMAVTLISDATGSLGTHVLQTVFTQFPPGTFALTTIPFVNTEERLAACLERLRSQTAGLVIHATIYDTFKRRIEETCRQQRLPAYDLTGPIVTFLVQASGQRPQLDYKRLHELSSDYFGRIDAMEYTIAHDDGAGLGTLGEADVVLVGVSRSTKTPTSMVLATRGVKAANVPLVLEVQPPKELAALDSRKVICLTADVGQMVEFRSKRALEQMGGFGASYTDDATIRTELSLALRLAERHHWRLLDVTGRAVEETAAQVLQLLGR